MKNKVRHLLSVDDVSAVEIREILDQAHHIKKTPALFADRFRGKTLGLIFEKPSTRTWISFEVGMSQLGGASVYLGPDDIQLGRREATKDVARVLSRYLDGMALRVFSHKLLEEFSRFAQVPVINGLSDLSHPCQAIADLFTIEEKLGGIENKKLAFVGDANNVLTSLLLLSAKVGLNMAYATPGGFRPSAGVVKRVRTLAKASKCSVEVFERPQDALRSADVVYTDVWISMGQEKERSRKKKKFLGFQLNQKLLKYAKPRARVMHCLPAHRGEEITDHVLESRQSIVFDQAENRLHVQKAILLKLIGS